MILDNSAFSLLYCDRRFELRVKRGLFTPFQGGKAPHEFGSAVHTGIELIDKGADIDEIFKKLFADYPDANREKLVKAIGAIVTMPKRPPVITLNNGKPALEVKFDYNYKDIKLAGTIDRIEDDDDILVIRDYKTAGDFSEGKAKDKLENYELTFQLLFYAWSLVKLDILTEAYARILLARKFRMEYTVIFYNLDPIKVKTVVIRPPTLENSHYDSMIENLIARAKAIVDSPERASMTGLTVYNGCKYCEFRRACKVAGTEEEEQILSRFETKEYNPLTFR